VSPRCTTPGAAGSPRRWTSWPPGKGSRPTSSVTDAYAPHKYLAHSPDAEGLFDAVGLDTLKDDGFVELGDGHRAAEFLTRCRELR
jgi:hypothetical protein